MKTTDFRIGNIITDENGFEMYVVGIGEDWLTADFEGNQGDVWEFDFKHSFPKPVEITEEILLKYGFVKDTETSYRWYLGEYFTYDLDDGGFRYKEAWVRLLVNYLHELQNIYFVLTNKNLEVK